MLGEKAEYEARSRRSFVNGMKKRMKLMSKCICLLLMSIVNCQLLIVNCYAQEIPLHMANAQLLQLNSHHILARVRYMEHQPTDLLL